MKRPNYFDELKDLFNSLFTAEKENVAAFMSSFDTSTARSSNKPAELINLLMSNPDISLKQAVNTLDLSMDRYNLNKFFSRVKDRLLESLLLDVNIQRRRVYSDSFKVQVDIQKKIMASRVLISRGLILNAEKLLEACLNRCRKYELYFEAAEALRIIQQLRGLEQGRRTFHRFSKDVQDQLEMARKKQLAEDWFLRYKMELNRKTVINDSATILKKGVAELQKISASGESDTVQYFYLYLKYFYEVNNHKYTQAQETVQTLSKLVETSSAVATTARVLAIWEHRADIEIRQTNFKEAEEIYEKYIKLLPANSAAYYTGIKYLLQTKMYQEKYGQVINHAQHLLSNDSLTGVEAEMDEIRYLLASAYFQQKEYRAAIQTADQIGATSNSLLAQYKNTLGAMAAMELAANGAKGQLVIASEFIHGLKHLRPEKRRDKVINRIMLKLKMFEYTYDRVYRRNIQDFELLQSHEENLVWEPDGYEFFTFQEWFFSILKKSGYKQPAKSKVKS